MLGNKRLGVFFTAVILAVSLVAFASVSYALDETVDDEIAEDAIQSTSEGEAVQEETLETAAAQTITGTFPVESGKDIATIRYYTKADKSEYAFADFSRNGNSYSYSFTAPYEGFTAVQGTSKDDGNATVIAEYYSTTKWDGTVDVSWYNENETAFEISTPAQLAGLAAIVNGSINSTTPIYKVKGTRSGDRAKDGDGVRTFDYDTPQTSKHQNINEGLPNCIENKYYEKTSLIAGVEDEAYKGLAKNDFSNKTVKITADLDMGGVDGSKIDHSKNFFGNTTDGGGANNYDYPNWTPIGGEYLMNPGDGSTMIISAFNGTLDGGGHHISNVYCFRWSYRSVGDTAFGYAQGTGLIGMMGSLYDGEEQPSVMPSVKNMSLSGYIFGRRMVGGFVGCMGGGSNAASGTSIAGGITMENLANHAYVYCTDSKGLGGIVACSMVDKGTIVNCYNDGNLETVYAAPSGGIIGSNEGMSIYCCYNAGKINSHGNSRGRGIGCNNSGKNYTVDDCYYLEGSGDDDVYPGYYTANLAKSVKVTTTSMSSKEMKDGTLLDKLNVNGTAYVAGSDGYPVLYWEKNASLGQGSLTVTQQEDKGTIRSTVNGNTANGTVAYLTNENKTGWKCRYFTLNGNRLSGDYVTINGASSISANYEAAKAGTLKIKSSDVCTVTVTKNGIIKDGDITKSVENYAVKSGDSLYEGDLLMLDVKLKEGAKPADENLIYKATQKDFFTQPYKYTYAYMNTDDELLAEKTESSVETFTVDSTIGKDDAMLVIDIEALTAKKMWDYVADISWYDDSKSEFTITKVEQLAGLSVLVDNGTDFAGKTVKLGNDISLKNNDGTSGNRYWDGIGSVQGDAGFAGTFDGCGHAVTDMDCVENGLFEYCKGKNENNKAVIKNLDIKGKSYGPNACGFIAKAVNTEISDCDSWCTITGTTGDGHEAGIIGYAYSNCTVKDCRNYGIVKGEGALGGLVGELSSTSSITDSLNSGNVYSYSTNGNSIGGLVGSLNGQVSTSANYGNIEAWGRSIGGLAGQSVSAKASIENCFNVGTVTYEKGTSSYDCMGGVIGFGSLYKISSSFNYGKVEKRSGTLPESNLGAIVGRETKNSKSLTENVYYLDGSCDFAEAGTKQEELTDADYSKGMKKATAEEFASAEGVLAQINGSKKAFRLESGGAYPVLNSTDGMHVHSGGTATCSELAECEKCGLKYGLYSSVHGSTKTVGKKEAVWMTDGYTGDICCEDCGKVITEGTVVKADTDKTAISVLVKRGAKTVSTRSYSIAEFDAIKTTGTPIGYSYGSKSDEIVVAASYVTLEKLLENEDLALDDIESIVVDCSSVKDTISADTLASCNRYYEGGKEYSAPAAFAIAWNTGIGKLADLATEATPGGSIRFGYGISKEQYENNESLGGRRLISPVNTVTINLTQPKVLYNNEKMALADAIDKANASGGTIKLTDDIDTGNDGFVIDAGSNEVTLDLDGNAISSNTEECILLESGTLKISGEGTVKGKIGATGGTLTACEGGMYTYEVEEKYCESGCVPELDTDSALYKITKKSAFEANNALNSLKKLFAELTCEVNKLKAQCSLLNVTVGVSSRAAAYNVVSVTWNADSSVDGFRLQKKVNGQWQTVNEGDAKFTEYTDVAEPGIQYSYRIAGAKSYEGMNGNLLVYGKYVETSVKTSLGRAAVSKLSTKKKKLTIKWNGVSGAQSYDIWIGTNSAVTKGLVKYSNVNAGSLTSKALKKNKKYYVKVRAHCSNSAGATVYGSWSAVKAIKCK